MTQLLRGILFLDVYISRMKRFMYMAMNSMARLGFLEIEASKHSE